MKATVLVDGGFYVKRYLREWRKTATDRQAHPAPDDVADAMHALALHDIGASNKHLASAERKELYRILFYDCVPYEGGNTNPVSKKYVNYSKSPTAAFRTGLHAELKKKRKVALRLGRMASNPKWTLSESKTKELCKDSSAGILDTDVTLQFRQKGVDMKIGLDIASLALKKMVDQIVLISGDSDFVPAAKLARREGIDFILDALGNHINDDLHEHIDGLLFSSPLFPSTRRSNES